MHKKSYRSILFCSFTLVVISLFGQGNARDMLKAHKWRLIDYRNRDGTLVTDDLKPSYANNNGNKFITIEFKTDSTLSFKTYMNDGAASFYFSKLYGSISLKLRFMTLVGEYPWGELFLKTIPLVTSFEVTETELKLKYESDSKYMRFIK